MKHQVVTRGHLRDTKIVGVSVIGEIEVSVMEEGVVVDGAPVRLEDLGIVQGREAKERLLMPPPQLVLIPQSRSNSLSRFPTPSFFYSRFSLESLS